MSSHKGAARHQCRQLLEVHRGRAPLRPDDAVAAANKAAQYAVVVAAATAKKAAEYMAAEAKQQKVKAAESKLIEEEAEAQAVQNETRIAMDDVMAMFDNVPWAGCPAPDVIKLAHWATFCYSSPVVHQRQAE